MKLAAPLVLLLAAYLLRVHRIEDHNVWWDEGFSIAMARLPLVEMAVRTAGDVHPPLHYLLLKVWTRLVGEGEYAARYSSVLLGVLDLALLYWLGRRYLGTRVALVALCLLAVNRLHVEWSQELRMYTLATAMVIGSTACFLRLTADRDRRLRWWIGHVVLSVAGLHTIYLFGLAPLSQSVVVGLAWVRGRVELAFLVRWVAAQTLALVLFVPWLLLYLRQPWHSLTGTPPMPLQLWMRAVFTALPVGISAYLDDWWAVTLAATLLMVGGVALWRHGRPGWLTGYAVAALVGSPLLVYALSLPNPLLYHPDLAVRYILLFQPFYALLVAGGLLLIARRSRFGSAALGIAAVVVCAGTLLDLYGSRHRRDEYRSIASFMYSYREPGDAVVLYSDWEWPVYQYYAPRDLSPYGIGIRARLTAESAAAMGSQYLRDHPGIWLVTLADAYDVDPEGHLRRWLETNARTLADFRVANRRLTLFSRDPARTLDRAVPPRGRPVQLPGRPELRSVEVPVREIAAGETLRVATFWTAGGADVHLALEGPDGQVYRRVGDRLAGAQTRGDHAVPLSDRLPPGGYALRLSAEPIAHLAVLPPARPPAPTLAPPDPPLPARQDRFGGLIDLVGAELAEPALEPGQPMRLRLLWQSVTAMERSYTAFLQLLGPVANPATGIPIWAQLDAPPERARPTSEWLPGDLALDERVLDVPRGLPGGDYRLIVGLYDPETGQRLLLPGGADHAELASWRWDVTLALHGDHLARP